MFVKLQKVFNQKSHLSVSIAARLATILLALARPTLRVVAGSRRGGGGGCWRGVLPPGFLGRVENPLGVGRVEEKFFVPYSAVTVNTFSCTRSPDFLDSIDT